MKKKKKTKKQNKTNNKLHRANNKLHTYLWAYGTTYSSSSQNMASQFLRESKALFGWDEKN